MSDFDSITIDDAALEDIATFIMTYCNLQSNIMNDYLQKMNSLSYEWKDDETLGKVLQEIRALTYSVNNVMDVIKYKYPEYFKKQAEIIRSRSNKELK